MPGSLTVVHVLEASAHGTGRHVVDLVRHVEGSVHHVVLPRRPTGRGERDRGATAAAATEAGATVHRVPLRRHPLHPSLPVAVLAVRRIARAVGADVLHGHATVGGVVARLAAATTGVPCVYTPNGLHPSRLVRVAERVLARWTDRLVTVSDSEAGLVARLGIATPPTVVVVPNGIELASPPAAEVDLRAQLGLAPTTPLVGFVGRLARQKAPEVLVAAAAMLRPDVHTVLLGDGPDRARVAAAIRDRGLAGRVHLLGHVDGADRLLDQLQVLALPSRWEGAPYVPLEAFRARVPVVATDVVGTRDVVSHDSTGLLVPPDDPVALAAAIRRVLNDADLARRLVAAARDELVARFDVRTMAGATRQVYEGVASNPPIAR